MSHDSSMDDLRRTLGDLEFRLARIEQHHSKQGLPLAAALRSVASVEELPPATPPLAVEPVVAQPAAVHQDSGPPIVGLVDRPKIFPQPVRAKPSRSLEATIGENWTGWIGAIVFVLGVLFFLKYAWDQGWIRPTPTMRVVAAIVTGIAISGLGEWMHRTGVKVLAAVLHGAGLAIVLASFFGAYALFDGPERVLSLGGAFSGVVITAAIGIFVALHIDAIVLAVIALIGAYLAPIVLNTGEDHSMEFLSYLGVLAAIGLALSYLKPRWGQIRAMVWVATVGLVFPWWLKFGERNEHQALATGFAFICFVMFLGQMVLTLRRWRDVDPTKTGNELAILSLLNTAAFCAMLRAAWPEANHDVMLGLAAIGLAVIHGAAAFATPNRAFSISSLLQSAGLFTLAVPLITDQFVITLAWLAMAAALAVLAWQLNIPEARGWAVVLLILSIGRLFLMDDSMRRAVLISGSGFTISEWTALVWSTAVLDHLLAWIRPGTPGRFPALEERFAYLASPIRLLHTHEIPGVLSYATPGSATDTAKCDPTGTVLALIGTAVFFIAVGLDFRDSLAMVLWLLWLGPIVLFMPVARQIKYFEHAALIGVGVTALWFLRDGAQPLADGWRRPHEVMTPILNLVAINGALLCGVVIGLIMQARRLPSLMRGTGIAPLIMWLVVLLFAMINFESLRSVDWLASNGASMRDPAIVKQVVMSVLWGLMGFATVLLGFRRDLAILRYVGLGLLGITLCKIFIFDMAEVRAVWRILSFLAMGVLLLGVSYVYHRQTEANEVTT